MKHLATALVAMLAFAGEGLADNGNIIDSGGKCSEKQQDKAQADAVIICNPGDNIWNNCPEIFQKRLGQNSENDTSRSSSPFGLWMFMPWHPTPQSVLLMGTRHRGGERKREREPSHQDSTCIRDRIIGICWSDG